jgi:hypothetical protein
MATIQQIIGKVNPKLYAANGKELLAKYGSSDNIPANEVKPKEDSKYELGYDSASDTLEPIYFFILDLMGDFGLSVEKVFDSFTSSPGSGHFGELGTRATIMQQQGTKILADINTVLRSVLNIIYDLRDFKMRLEHYDHLKDNKTKEAALLALKQIWMDKVDISKGNSSIKAMALGQAGFQTLIDAFLVVDSPKDISKLDLNDRVKRILTPRIQEFNIWLNSSEKELKKRYEIERSYLRSQANSLKLYARWAKPYLMAANELEMGIKKREPALVKAFNTIMFDLTLFGKSDIKPENAALEGSLPREFSKLKIRRKYTSCILVDFKFRGIPQKIGGQQSHYVFGGKTNITFTSYALNENELKKIDKELDDDSIKDVLNLIEGATTDTLNHLQEEINFFLDDLDDSSNPSSSSNKDQSNPFIALIGGYNKPSPKPAKKSSGGNEDIIIAPDNFLESTHLRPFAKQAAEDKAFALFDVYKKAHGMVSYT